jgi:arylsulfatase A-like enzyme
MRIGEAMGRCVAAVVLGMGLVVLCAACTEQEPAGAPVERAAFQRVVLVAIEGLRWDHLGHRGYLRVTSPFLDELVEKSVVFDRAYAQSARSTASLASLLTSLYPAQHGVWRDGDSLGTRRLTLAGLLRGAGVQTVGIAATHALWIPGGLSRGFEHFAAPPEIMAQRNWRAPDAIDTALAWQERLDPAAPSFLFVNLADLRKPWRPPDGHIGAATQGADTATFVEFLQREHHVSFGFYRYDHRRVQRTIDHYDGAIHYVDGELARLHRTLAARGWGEGTLWIVTSSHGLGLGNHFWEDAGRLIYEVEVRVPLLIHTPGGEFGARHVGQVVEHVDLLPTVLELAMPGELPDAARPQLQGRSLAPLLRGEELPARAALVQRGSAPRRLREPAVPGGPGPDPGQLDALVEERWKLLLHSSGRAELYDVEADPYETQDLLRDGAPLEAERLRQALEARLAALGSAGTESPPQ